jgi:hypothetical protein
MLHAFPHKNYTLTRHLSVDCSTMPSRWPQENAIHGALQFDVFLLRGESLSLPISYPIHNSNFQMLRFSFYNIHPTQKKLKFSAPFPCVVRSRMDSPKSEEFSNKQQCNWADPVPTRLKMSRKKIRDRRKMLIQPSSCSLLSADHASITSRKTTTNLHVSHTQGRSWHFGGPKQKII